MIKFFKGIITAIRQELAWHKFRATMRRTALSGQYMRRAR